MHQISQNKTIAKNSLILYGNLIVTSIFGLLATRYVLLYLGVSDFGLYSVVGSVVVMMNFFNTVMVSTTYRYIAFEMGRNDGKDVNKVFNISLTIHLAMVVVVVLLAETLGVWYIFNKLNVEAGKLGDALFVFRLSVLAAIFNIVSIPFQGFVTAVEKFSVRAGIEILRSVLMLALVIWLGYMLDNKLRIYAIMMAGLTLFISGLFISYCKYYYAKFVAWKLQKDKAKYKEMVAYSGWIMIGAAASVGRDTGSQLLINAFFCTILNAAFGLANRITSLVGLFAQSLMQAAMPQITKSFSSGNTNRTILLSAYTSKYIFFLMLLPAIPILLETNFLLNLWLGEAPQYTTAFSQLMIVNALIANLGGAVPIAQATGKIKYFQIILSTTSLISLPVAYLLLKAGYPPTSILYTFIFTSMINTVVSQILLSYIIVYDVKLYLKIAYLKGFFVVIMVLPLFLIHDFFPAGLYRFILSSVVSVIWLIFAVYIAGIDKHEKERLKLFANSLIVKTKSFL